MKLVEKLKSDKAAVGSTETIMLVALAIFLVLAIYRTIVLNMVKSATGIGVKIREMDPKGP